ncbi:MAG: exonuclease SbcCD subunit D [Clostridia bacterium]|nr:exonuclease SbcCD subunit D [Clostridia bacterium]
MRFFHLSDLHLGIRLRDHDLRDDQLHILNQIVQAAADEKPDAVLIAGDVFDKSDPGPDAVAMFSDFVTALKEAVPEAAIMIISGNHDNGERINLYQDILKIAGVYVAGRLQNGGPECVTLHDEDGPVHFYLLPFVRPGAVRAMLDAETPLTYAQAVDRLVSATEAPEGERRVLVSHQFYVPAGEAAEDVERMDSELPQRGNLDAVPGEILSAFNYAALGHIHKPMRVGERAWYCGTPLAYSLSERGQHKSIVAVDLLADGEPEIERLPLRPLHAVRRLEGTLDEVTGQPSGDYIEVILTGEKNTDSTVISSRLRHAFPRLLGYRHAVDMTQPAAGEAVHFERRQIDPMQLCIDFLGDDADEENQRILAEILAELEENK